MADILFYHLERRGLEDVLPGLVERALERGWRVAVETGSDERARALDAHLWAYDDASFLPHGPFGDPRAASAPVVIGTGPANPNGAQVRFFVDRARLDLGGDYERRVLIFDGRDADALAAARDDWKAANAAGIEATYWKQDERGRWTKAG